MRVESDGSGGRVFTLFLVAAAIVAGLYLAFGPKSSEEASQPAPVEAPPPLPCIDERCTDRPERLKCVEWANGAPASCVMWDILYETHCQCFERAAPKADGSTP